MARALLQAKFAGDVLSRRFPPAALRPVCLGTYVALFFVLLSSYHDMIVDMSITVHSVHTVWAYRTVQYYTVH